MAAPALALDPAPAAALRAAYAQRLEHGQLSPDPAQAALLEALAQLSEALAAYRPPLARPWWRPWLGRTNQPRGLYLWGGVGRGKSMLMDLFFDHAPVAQKKRVHFHSFMRDLHARIHQLRTAHPEGYDPLPPLAAALAREAWLLCFDEMQVNDITDAMLIRRLFALLHGFGVVMVITSNRPPADLYLNGLQRGQFLPFIEQLQTTMEVRELQSAADYRRQHLERLEHTYRTPNDVAANAWLQAQFGTLTHGAPARPRRIKMPGRSWLLPLAAGEVAMASFADLCDQPLGAADYMELARQCSTLLVADIPLLSPAARNAAKRFVLLIDVLYEAKVKLLATAAAEPDHLYPAGDGAFEFARTASRLIEMQSPLYLALPWARPADASHPETETP